MATRLDPAPPAARRWRRRARRRRAATSTLPSGRSRSVTPEPEVARHQRLRRRQAQVVAFGLQPLAHLDDVAVAFGGEHADLGALPLQQRIGGDRRAMDDALGARQQGGQVAGPARRRGCARPSTTPSDWSAGVLAALARVWVTVGGDADHVGEGAADIDADRAGIRAASTPQIRAIRRSPPPRRAPGPRVALLGRPPAAAAAGLDQQPVAGLDGDADFLGLQHPLRAIARGAGGSGAACRPGRRASRRRHAARRRRRYSPRQGRRSRSSATSWPPRPPRYCPSPAEPGRNSWRSNSSGKRASAISTLPNFRPAGGMPLARRGPAIAAGGAAAAGPGMEHVPDEAAGPGGAHPAR